MAGETLLIVDDNAQNLKLARVVLEEAGFEVHTAGDADQAVAVLARIAPALILMDLQMPRVDGFELTRRLKADPQRARIPIVALTANAMTGDEVKAYAAGCDGYITKPIDVLELPKTVARHIARRRNQGG